MRAIEREMVAAFNGNRNFRKSNTQVVVNDGKVDVFLFGNKISTKDIATGEVRFSNCGFDTITTASRLRALGARCGIKNGVMYGVTNEIL